MAPAGPEPERRSGQRPHAQQSARHWAEEVARRHLEQGGWHTLACNYRLRGGEIDLVMEQGDTVVFVEVRQRRSARFGYPAETIDRRKLQRLRSTAQHFLVFELKRPAARWRLDAVLLLGDEHSYRLQHIEDV